MFLIVIILERLFVAESLTSLLRYSQANQVFENEASKYGEFIPKFFEKQMLLAIDMLKAKSCMITQYFRQAKSF